MNEVFDQVVLDPLRVLFLSVQVFLPRIFWAMGVLLIGYLLSIVLRQIVHYLLWAVGLNMAAERAGISAFLRRGHVDRQPSELVGALVSWVIAFASFMIALYHLGLTAAEQILLNFFLYVPQGLVALVIVIVGLFLAGFTARLVEGSVAAANIRAASLLGYGARVVIVVLACFIALEKLDIGLGGLMVGMVVVLVSIPIGLVFAFCIGGRQFIQDLIAGQSLIRVLSPGDSVSVAEHRGEIAEIGLTATTIHTPSGEVLMANSVLAAQVVVVRSRVARPESTSEESDPFSEEPDETPPPEPPAPRKAVVTSDAAQ
ncbi:MAG: mechanosensitive ion channel [Candidatus Latescibacteria bacterium]|nr:mechanosensitive ion channel [Candidatus Latescibacterota bacterium]